LHDGFSVVPRIEHRIRKGIAAQEILQGKKSWVSGVADKNGPVSAFDHEDSSQNQGTHDLFAEIGFIDHHGA
jgi:hypothetical protein